MSPNLSLEERTNISLTDFSRTLRKYGIEGLSYPAFFLGGDRAGVIDIHSPYSNNEGWVRIAVFKTREDDKGSVFDIRLLSGPANDILYLEASSKLRKALERERIPFTEEQNVGELRKEASKYARKLLKISEDL